MAGRLAVAGVDRSTAALALEDAPDDEEDAAERLAAERASRASRGSSPRSRSIGSRGSSRAAGTRPTIARRAARKALELDADEG